MVNKISERIPKVLVSTSLRQWPMNFGQTQGWCLLRTSMARLTAKASRTKTPPRTART